MAEKEIVAQIDKLRKTRPARAVEAMAGNYSAASEQLPMLRDDLVSALSMLRDDLKDEVRLVEQAKLRGGTSIMKDRLAVAGWLELFVVQLGRESDETGQSTAERLSPSHELTDHRPSERGTDAASLPGPGGRCAVGNVHTANTTKCPCGLDMTASGGPHYLSTDMNQAGSVTDYLSGVSDTLPTRPNRVGNIGFGSDMTTIIDAATYAHDSWCNTQHAADGNPCPPEIEQTAAYIGDTPIEQVVGTNTGQGPTGIMTALGLSAAEQQAHDTIDRELAHVTADPIVLPVVDPFAPIPRAVWAPAVPPNGRAWTSADLLAPVDAASLPPHLSFSQATTAVECGAKYRMQRIANAPQVPQWANVGGKAFHSAVELIERGKNGGAEVIWEHELEAQIVIVETESGMTREQFRASGQGREGYDWWRVEGAAMLQRYVDWRQSAGAHDVLLNGPSGAPMLEWETTYDVDGVPFKTILDSVWTDSAQGGMVQGRTAIIRDWKTGSMTPDNRQLCTQAWGLRKAGWQGEILVQFFDARKGTFSEPFDPFDAEHGGMSWDDVRYFVLSGDAQRRLPILPARPSDFCGGCSVAYACPIMSQRKAPKAATK